MNILFVHCEHNCTLFLEIYKYAVWPKKHCHQKKSTHCGPHFVVPPLALIKACIQCGFVSISFCNAHHFFPIVLHCILTKILYWWWENSEFWMELMSGPSCGQIIFKNGGSCSLNHSFTVWACWIPVLYCHLAICHWGNNLVIHYVQVVRWAQFLDPMTFFNSRVQS